MKEESGAVSESRFDQELSRRRLLKILAASGGAVAATAVLPGKWMKPVVDLGVLPAHAQLSQTGVEITSFTVSRGSVQGTVVCEDLNGNIDGNSLLWVWASGDSCDPDPATLIDGNPFSWYNPDGDRFKTTLEFWESLGNTEGCNECFDITITAQFQSGGIKSPKKDAELEAMQCSSAG